MSNPGAWPYTEIQELKAEIERLRGLLRESLEGIDDYWISTAYGVDWERRVREALGDE